MWISSHSIDIYVRRCQNNQNNQLVSLSGSSFVLLFFFFGGRFEINGKQIRLILLLHFAAVSRSCLFSFLYI